MTSRAVKQKRREVNYAARQVWGEAIIDTRQSNIVNALQRKVAGVSITSSGGAPGEGSSIVIRGGNLLEGVNQPLFVIDGVIIDSSSFAESTVPGGGSGFNGLLGRSAGTPNRASYQPRGLSSWESGPFLHLITLISQPFTARQTAGRRSLSSWRVSL